MKNQEAYQDITSWENSISSLKKNLKEESTQKNKEKDKNTLEESVMRLMCSATRVCKTVLKSIVFNQSAERLLYFDITTKKGVFVTCHMRFLDQFPENS